LNSAEKREGAVRTVKEAPKLGKEERKKGGLKSPRLQGREQAWEG